MTSKSTPAPPPSPQEIARKLSVHAKPKCAKKATASGGESDSDSHVETLAASPAAQSGGSSYFGQQNQNPALQSIAEARSSGEDSDDDGEEGRLNPAEAKRLLQQSSEEVVAKAGYLWKKRSSRRKTWKKRWFVLRSPHLAVYKNQKEYELLRLVDISEIHSVMPIDLPRHEHTFGVVHPQRTFYLQAASQEEALAWVRALNDMRDRLLQTQSMTANSVTPAPTPPIRIPARNDGTTKVTPGGLPSPITPPARSAGTQHTATSSDEEDGDALGASVTSAPSTASRTFSPATGGGAVENDPSKVLLQGYLMKCGSKRRNWRKRWFVLTGEKLIYCGSHMDNHKHQRQIPMSQVLDAMEVSTLRTVEKGSTHLPSPSPPLHTVLDELAEGSAGGNHTFKIVTTKRSIVLCAPSEDEEIKWLSAVRAVVARRAGRQRSGSTGGLDA